MDNAVTQVAQERFQLLTQLPWLMLAAFALPLVVAAWRLKIFPTVVWIVLLCVSLVTGLATIFYPSAVVVVGILDGLIVTVAAMNCAHLPGHQSRHPSHSRDAPHLLTWRAGGL